MATVAPPRPTTSPPRRAPAVPGPPAPQPRLQRRTARRSRFSVLIASLAIVAGILLIALSLWPQVVESPSDMGSVVTSQTLPSGTTVLALRRPSGQVSILTLGAGSRMLTSDGAFMAASDAIPGDRITANPASAILTDVSERTVTLRGTIASSPGPTGDHLIVRSEGGNMIVARLAGSTRINGAAMTSTSEALLQDSERVTVRGVLNGRLGVMIVTYEVTSTLH